MSRRTEHIEDVITNQADAFEAPIEEVDEEEEEDLFTPDEKWESWHQDHLLNMYFSLKEYCDCQGLDFMDRITFPMLCQFLYNKNIYNQ